MVGLGSQRAPYVAALAATIVSGLLTYAFLALVSRALDAEAFDVFSVFWSLSLLVGFGLFVPLEQELARTRGESTEAVHETLLVGLLFAVVAVVALIAVAATDALTLPAGVLLAMVAVALLSPVQYTAKGFLLQRDRIFSHSAATVLENLVRTGIALTAFIVAFSTGRSDDPTLLAASLVIALLAGYAWALVPALGRPLVRRDPFARRLRVVLAILVPSVVGQALLNAGPLVIDALVATPGATGAFQATFNLARLPLFLVLPLQALLIGRMAVQIQSGRGHELRRMLALLGLGIAGVALVGALIGWLIGPWTVELLFGPGRALPAGDVAALVAAVCVYVGLVINTQALIVTGRTRAAGIAWIVALVLSSVAFAAIAPFAGVVSAIALALLVGSLLSWMLTVAQLRWRTEHAPS
jgi:O-antigen/teichoic acid export membrane protein